ncbi:MAG: hypothetical protein HQM04_18115 [Magnetococcales bacterium]|nr:hypothetical protein [Magnetococcales bacterium]MBF0116943.1 hypothetical protein [Magnetococcales bacterium]
MNQSDYVPDCMLELLAQRGWTSPITWIGELLSHTRSRQISLTELCDKAGSIDAARGLLLEGSYLAFGVRNGSHGQYELIPPGEWHGLTVVPGGNVASSDRLHYGRIVTIATDALTIQEAVAVMDTAQDIDWGFVQFPVLRWMAEAVQFMRDAFERQTDESKLFSDRCGLGGDEELIERNAKDLAENAREKYYGNMLRRYQELTSPRKQAEPASQKEAAPSPEQEGQEPKPKRDKVTTQAEYQKWFDEYKRIKKSDSGLSDKSIYGQIQNNLNLTQSVETIARKIRELKKSGE